MISHVIAVFTFLFAMPDLSLKWATPHNEALQIHVQDSDPRLNECLEAGFRVRYRFEIKLCNGEEGWGWFAQCSKARTIYHWLEYDALTENYKLSSDMLNDGKEAETESLTDKSGASDRFTSINNLPLSQLVSNGSSYRYARVRLISDCKGEYNETIAKVGYFLSLGLYRFNQSDTGWIRFSLDTQTSNEGSAR